MTLINLDKSPNSKLKKIKRGQQAFFNKLDQKFWFSTTYVVLYSLMAKVWFKSFCNFFNYYFMGAKIVRPGIGEGLKMVFTLAGLGVGFLGYIIASTIMVYKICQALSTGMREYSQTYISVDPSLEISASPSLHVHYPRVNEENYFQTPAFNYDKQDYVDLDDRPPPYNLAMQENIRFL